MNVKELIDELLKQDPTAMVVIAGYEGGVREVVYSGPTTLAFNANSPNQWYYGPHEILHPYHDEDSFPGCDRGRAIYVS